MSDLPTIFKQLRVPLRKRGFVLPLVVLSGRESDLPPTVANTDKLEQGIFLSMWDCFWIEIRCDMGDLGVHPLAFYHEVVAETTPGGEREVKQWRVSVFSEGSGTPLDVFEAMPALTGNTGDWSGERKSAMLLCLRVLAHIGEVYGTASADKPVAPAPLTEWVTPPAGRIGKPKSSGIKALIQRRSTVTYARLSDAEFRREVSEAKVRGMNAVITEAGRKRLHDVRGHWRTYASGRRVWVREHKRGDAELGEVTRVISL